MVTVPGEQAPANSVPAAAVRRRVLALFGITGRKGRAGGLASRARKPGAQPRTGARAGGGGREVARVWRERGAEGARGRPRQSGAKARGSTPERRPGRRGWRPGEGGGIPSVEVKFVDIGWNTGGEGGRLARS